jgi:glutamate/tyrosine decarboxylase-like PLP-dependent enzyme
MLWATSPACTELETRVLDWLVPALGLPEKFLSTSSGGGVIQDTASSATLCAVLAARERVTNFSSNNDGCRGKLVAYTSAQAHSSIEKAVKIAGIGRNNLRLIEVDERFAMKPEGLRAAIRNDREAGLMPFLVCATVGTTSSNAIDPVPEVGKICREHNLWLHVDAAMAGSAMILPECRTLWDGVEWADSLVVNPHKWLGVSFDCSTYFVRDPQQLVRVMSTNPSYLQTAADGQVKNYRDWGIPLGRRMRALKLWFVIREQGVAGLQARIRRDLGHAQWLLAQVKQAPHW